MGKPKPFEFSMQRSPQLRREDFATAIGDAARNGGRAALPDARFQLKTLQQTVAPFDEGLEILAQAFLVSQLRFVCLESAQSTLVPLDVLKLGNLGLEPTEPRMLLGEFTRGEEALFGGSSRNMVVESREPSSGILAELLVAKNADSCVGQLRGSRIRKRACREFSSMRQHPAPGLRPEIRDGLVAE